MSSGRGVAAWVSDSIISSGVQVGVGTSTVMQAFLESQATRNVGHSSACKGLGVGDGLTVVVNGPPKRPLASLLCETNDASLTTKCLIMPGVCTVPDPSPRPSAFHDSSTSTTSSR